MLFKRKPDAHLVEANGGVGAFAQSDDGDQFAQSEANSNGATEPAWWYLKQARKFEASRQQQDKREKKIAWTVTCGLGLIATVSIVASATLVQLKRPNPPAVLRMNDTTGVVDVLNVTPDNSDLFTQKNDRADLRRYVETRESYDWELLQSSYDMVKLMTADKERDRYMDQYDGPDAPQKRWKDQTRVIAQVGAITFVNKADDSNKVAQVLFSRKILSLNGSTPPTTEYFVATIAYRHDNLQQSKSELERDPTGFRVISYVLDRDWTRTSDSLAPASSATPAPMTSAPVTPAANAAVQRGGAQ